MEKMKAVTLGVTAEELCWKALNAPPCGKAWRDYDPSIEADRISDILSEIIQPVETNFSHLEEELAYKARKLIMEIISHYLPDDDWQVKEIDEEECVVLVTDKHENVLIKVNPLGEVKVSALKEGQNPPCSESCPWVRKRGVLHCYDYCRAFWMYEALERYAFEVKQALKDLL